MKHKGRIITDYWKHHSWRPMISRKEFVMNKAERHEFDSWLKRQPKRIPAKLVSDFYVRIVLKRYKRKLERRRDKLALTIREAYNGITYVSGNSIAGMESKYDLLLTLIEELEK